MACRVAVGVLRMYSISRFRFSPLLSQRFCKSLLVGLPKERCSTRPWATFMARKVVYLLAHECIGIWMPHHLVGETRCSIVSVMGLIIPFAGILCAVQWVSYLSGQRECMCVCVCEGLSLATNMSLLIPFVVAIKIVLLILSFEYQPLLHCVPFIQCRLSWYETVALAQVMARIQLTSTGDRLVTLQSRSRMSSYVCFALLLVILNAVYAGYFLVAEPEGEAILIATLPLAGLDIGAFAYFIFMVATTRRLLRKEYSIPELRCRGCEDCCMSVFCTCCTIAQMGRHTADYETYRAYCCTDTGLASHIEVKLPCENETDQTTVEWI